MIRPKELITLLHKCLQDFQVQSIFVSTKDGQMIAQAGQTP